VANAGRSGPSAALTGPVVRGDAETVAAHIRALRRDLGDADAAFYAALSEALVRVAAARHRRREGLFRPSRTDEPGNP
jgi:predicted short-subunit dehydrogenase-like oxidoreductase (DUF2520 family)